MVSSDMGLNFGVFGFLPTTHAKTMQNQCVCDLRAPYGALRVFYLHTQTAADAVCLFVYSFFIEGNSTSVTSTAFQAGPHFTENNIYIIIIQYIQYFTIYMIVNLIHDIKNRFFLDENYQTILIKFVEFLI